jgi:hypothetical protein
MKKLSVGVPTFLESCLLLEFTDIDTDRSKVNAEYQLFVGSNMDRN